MRTEKLLAAIAIPAMLAVSAAHAAQPAYPEKPIRLVIGSAPGSGPDIISRALADRLYGAWGQRIVVDSRPGVAGILSADLVLRAAPDGYTWMMLTSQLLVATAVYPNVKFNLERDFASISLIGTVPFVLVINPEVPAKSIRELIEVAKKTPLRYGSAGTGASEHLSGVLFTRLTGTDILHVPYKGVAEALAATMGKEVNLTYGVLPAVLAMIQAGRVRALGVTSPKRAALLPDVPSISETVPGYQTLGWYSLVAPTGTPETVLAKASGEVAKAVKEPQFGEQLKALGLDLVGSSRSELDAFRRAQSKQISEIVKASGVDVK
ncbi:MAG TPA: tripartite tricarboxylate transporter substrate-binding protein [Burkholderiales bacterium]|nr:tripartite tricarboxylate transporter substrate-binding protein [Burkholderiales bacterium]